MAQPNLAFIYCTGGVEIYVRFPDASFNPQIDVDPQGDILYLGTTEINPEDDFQPQYKPMFAAQGGDMVPIDQMTMGVILQVNLDLARFSQTVLTRVQDVPGHGRFPGINPPGLELFGERGQLMLANNLAYEMWLYNPMFPIAVLAGNPAYPDLHPGLYLRACQTLRVFRGKDGVSQSKAMVSVNAMPVFRSKSRQFQQYRMDAAVFAPMINLVVEPG